MSYFFHFTILLLGTYLVTRIKIGDNKRFFKYIGFFVFSFLLRLVLIYVNEELNFFADKLAGSRAASIHLHYRETGNLLIYEGNFLLQWLINYPFFELNGATLQTILITNAYIGSIVPLFTAYYVHKIYGTKFENYVLFAFSFFLCFVNFSIFGLRDIIIMAIVSISALSIIYLFDSARGSARFYKAGAVYAFTNFLILYIRPEMIAILGLPFLLYLFSRVLKFIGRINEKNARFLAYALSIGLFLVSVYFVANTTAVYLAGNVGAGSEVSTTEIIDVYAEQRYQRQFRGTGGGSAIVDPSSYQNLSTGSRLTIQILGMIVIPFPWEITSTPKLLAFVDTLVVLFLLVNLFRFFFSQIKSRHDRLSRFFGNPFNILGLTFLFSILLYGFLVINFGNAFRLRMSILPYLIIPAIYFLSQKNSREYAS
jgi:hypothetical protein